MKIQVLLVLLATLAIGSVNLMAAELENPILLEDGSYLFVDEEDGTTRMVDKRGRPMTMPSNVEMKTADGEVILMRNNRVWTQYGPPGKQRRGLQDK